MAERRPLVLDDDLKLQELQLGDTLPGGALPPATAIGQMIISTDGSTLTVQDIAVSDLGEIAVDDNGIIGVVG